MLTDLALQRQSQQRRTRSTIRKAPSYKRRTVSTLHKPKTNRYRSAPTGRYGRSRAEAPAPLLDRYGWCLLIVCLTGCAPGAGGSDAGREAGAEQDSEDASQAPEAEAAQPSEYRIYDANQCDLAPLPSGLEVKPTQLCDSQSDACMPEVCYSEADCSERPFGRCKGYLRETQTIEFARCVYEDCETDDDCAQGESCQCGLAAHECVHTDCANDDDCPQGEQCVRADVCGWGPFGPLVCTHPEDECRTNEDCSAEEGNSCAFDKTAGHLVCLSIICD